MTPSRARATQWSLAQIYLPQLISFAIILALFMRCHSHNGRSWRDNHHAGASPLPQTYYSDALMGLGVDDEYGAR